MSIIGSSWKDEETPEEQYESITGNKYQGDKGELHKQIEKDIDDSYTSKTERIKLMNLQSKLNNNNNEKE